MENVAGVTLGDVFARFAPTAPAAVHDPERSMSSTTSASGRIDEENP